MRSSTAAAAEAASGVRNTRTAASQPPSERVNTQIGAGDVAISSPGPVRCPVSSAAASAVKYGQSPPIGAGSAVVGAATGVVLPSAVRLSGDVVDAGVVDAGVVGALLGVGPPVVMVSVVGGGSVLTIVRVVVAASGSTVVQPVSATPAATTTTMVRRR